MELILEKGRLDDWIAALEGWQAFAPSQEDEVWGYRPTASPVRLDHPNTVQPPKNFAFPQREVFFRFEQVKGEPPRLTPVEPDAARNVVFGVRPCDGRGVVRMDTVFSDHVEDSFYLGRRKNLAYVGLACLKPASRHCFCKSVGGSPVSTEGLDVLMTDLGDCWLLASATPVGETLMQAAGALLTEPSAEQRMELARRHEEALARPQKSAVADVGNAATRLKDNFDSPLWEELGKACIACGICTYLCPTCHCFDLNDEVSGGKPLRGGRVRTWDSCQFPDFTMHSSGHNPRDSLGSRLRQRVSHKFRYFVENFGTPQCTGCGRCVSQCPVGIDIVNVVNRVCASV
ncbi:MAG: 4Fe-4S dicluster domain-containing protein [Rhodocyclaceae bacterium]|nr:4Fe-4S dicluster domain-containing protein [Rhodocyclaceae bacterium]